MVVSERKVNGRTVRLACVVMHDLFTPSRIEVSAFPVLMFILPDQSACATVFSIIDVVASRVFCFENFP